MMICAPASSAFPHTASRVCQSYSGYLRVMTPDDLEAESKRLAELRLTLFVDDEEYFRRKSELDQWQGKRPEIAMQKQPPLSAQRPLSNETRRAEHTPSHHHPHHPAPVADRTPHQQDQRRDFSTPYRADHHSHQPARNDNVVVVRPPTSSAQSDQRHHEAQRGPRTIPLYPTKNWAAKYWLGYPLPASNVEQLQRASARLGSRFKEPHMSLGWCIVTDFLYQTECGSVLSEFQQIGAEMRQILELRHTGFDIVGAERNKVAAFYQPFDKRKNTLDDLLFLQFNERILEMFRAAARRAAQKRNVPFKNYLDPAKDRAIEIGEIGGIRVYEMKAVRPTFHVTVGSHGAASQKHLVDSIKCSPMEFPASGFYMEEGKRRKI